MRDSRSKVWPAVAAVVALFLVTSVYLLHRSCAPDARASEAGLCANGLDDDGDGTTDCDDLECYLDDPSCAPARRDASSARDDEAATEEPDAFAGPDTVAVEEPVEDRAPATPDAGAGCAADPDRCDHACRLDSECVLVSDMWECCGGFPHQTAASPDLVSCVTAVHRDRVTVDRCAVPLSPGSPLQSIPDGCRPVCEGVSCPPCPEATGAWRAVCREGRCRALCDGCCIDDRDCRRGWSCVDPAHTGWPSCQEGVHECTTGNDCFAISTYTDCRGCNCGDVTRDGLRDCACYGCGGRAGPPRGTCVSDHDCRPHELCEDRRCTFMGDDVCREALNDCGPCGFCQRNRERFGDRARGTCVPIDWGDAGPPPGSGCTE
jgi:hypothetical protein